MSEIGDRTFFVVIIYYNKFKVVVLFILASVCMVFMNTLSVTIGSIFALLIPKIATSIIVVFLFLFFGILLLFTTFKAQKCFTKDPVTGKRFRDNESEDEFAEVMKEVEEHDKDVKELE